MSSAARMVRSPQPLLCLYDCTLRGFFSERSWPSLMPTLIFRKFFLRFNFSSFSCGLNFYPLTWSLVGMGTGGTLKPAPPLLSLVE